ncbi:N-acetylmuramoyl-L-alanine amidase family protein [Paenibacillus sp. ACRRY]|uniref:N-acetylmuramoyl-L-alanine amidase family protein n=1 Tax=Paenibacillus sp. ACRRY TaxID=2918208 RepID=UPI001EF5B6EB|nr:N-acetylmuramoyl-L-alanine amidase family protein [Paenibacillus sp. ACRRY]MCG7385918.1 N-acetylmuramoyl-L-alanine amidase family protein [Paenibacillus sp. ACRRY]
MKKWSAAVVIFLFMCLFPVAAHAGVVPSIVLDGVTIDQRSGAPAENVGNTVMVPIRIVSESLGYQVKWEKESKSVLVQKGSQSIAMTAGEDTATVNGSPVELDSPPLVKQGTTLVPLRFVGEGMGLEVGWDNGTKMVSLRTASPVAEQDEEDEANETPSPSLNAELQSISFSSNRLMITTNGEVKPKLSTLGAPDRIIVDMPETTFSDSFMQGHAFNSDGSGSIVVTDSAVVSKVRYAMFSHSPSTVRVVFDLKQSATAQWSLGDNNVLLVDLTASSGDSSSQPALPTVDGKKVVIIDPGHGGRQSGAVSISGKYEKDFNLAVGLKVQALLQKHDDIQTVITRQDDTELSLQQRVEMAELNQADIFISIHGNKFTTPDPNGIETLYSRIESKTLADMLHTHIMPVTGLKDRGVKMVSLHVTRETSMPAVLLELGFMSNPTDEALMLTEDYQERCAEAIVDGIIEFLGL